MSRLFLAGCIVLLGLLVASRTDTSPRSPAPKRFTFQSRRAPLSKILNELAQQTGTRVEDAQGKADQPLALDLRDVTFWAAVDAIAREAGAVVSVTARAGKISLSSPPAGYRRPPTWTDGDFRLTLRRISTTRDLDSDGGSCSVSLEVAWVPGLLPLFLETQPQGLRLLDDRNRPVPVLAEGSALAAVEGRSAMTLDVTLPALPRSAARIGLLEGKLTAIAPSKMLTFQLDTLDRLARATPGSAPRKQTLEGVVCAVDKLTLVRDRWSLRFTLGLPEGGKKFESFQASTWVVHNELILTSKDGKKRLKPTSYVLESVSSRKAVLTYNFVDKPGAPRGQARDWLVAYRMPALIVEVPIQFAFKDVPLP
jgi:hypothetical protein